MDSNIVRPSGSTVSRVLIPDHAEVSTSTRKSQVLYDLLGVEEQPIKFGINSVAVDMNQALRIKGLPTSLAQLERFR